MKKKQKSELYKKAEKFVDESFAKEDVKHKHTPIHLKTTVSCVQELRQDASEALLVAALLHDIERAFVWREINGDGFKDPDYLKEHQSSCAKITRQFLEKAGTDKALTIKIENLVASHEVGGDEDQNILKDADSLAFFRGGSFNSIAKMRPEANIRSKIDYMYERITSKEAREIAKPMYKKAIKGLESV